MIPETNVREVQMTGVQAEAMFSISAENANHVMGILRDSVYSDKIMAPLREYSANAWDAHRSIGKGDLPIQVTLPTEEAPTLVIRDFGPGMSEENVLYFYTQFGDSSKRKSPNEVGTLGIGSKSGFSYTESFTVISWHGGKKTIYVAYLTESDESKITKNAEFILEGEAANETGMEIRIPVKLRDIDAFHEKAKYLFRYFPPRPTINIELPDNETLVTEHGFIRETGDYGYHQDWIAVMGCIPYKLDLRQIESELREEGYWDTLYHLNGGLYFPIGGVPFNASREELRYTEKCKANLVQKFKDLFDGYVEGTIQTIESAGASMWDKRLKVRFLTQSLRLPVLKKYREFSVGAVDLYPGNHKPTTFTLMTRSSGVTNKVIVSSHTKVYYRDDTRTLSGFRFDETTSLIISPHEGVTREAVMAEFYSYVVAAGLDGLGVDNLSQVPWVAPTPKNRSRSTSAYNKKYQVNTFRLIPEKCRLESSASWEIEKREPQSSDVYVILDSFKAINSVGFYGNVAKDRNACKALGFDFPPVYGYKTTKAKPITEDKCQGTPYDKWRPVFFEGLLNDLILKKWSAIQRAEILDLSLGDYFETREFQQNPAKRINRLATFLGEDHPLVRYFFSGLSAKNLIDRMQSDEIESVRRIVESTGKTFESSPKDEQKAFLIQYPLLTVESGLANLLKSGAKMWANYVLLVDRDLRFRSDLVLAAG